MRIGINGRFLAARPTGVQRFGLEVLRALIGRADLLLFLPRGVRTPPDLEPDLRHIRGRWARQAWEQIELPFTARRAGADVHLHHANSAPRFGGPNVVVLHDVLPLTHPSDFTFAYRTWVRFAHVGAARKADAIVTVSAWSADHLSGLLAVPRERIAVVRQGAGPLDRPASDEAVEAVRRVYGLAGPYFLAVGADPRKGASFLHETWRSCFTSSDPELLVVGRSYDDVHRRPPERIDSHGVRYLGVVPDEDLHALTTGAVALLHPSVAEGFGRPPLEALACGTRAIVAPYGPAREVLGQAADVVPLESEAWASAVRAVLEEGASVREERVVRGREHARAFTWDGAAEALLEICEAAASKAR